MLRLLQRFSIGMVILGSVSACRLGNHTETVAAAPTWEGAYTTLPQSYHLCSTILDPAHPDAPAGCGDAAATKIPDEIATVMTNPVGLYLNGAASGNALLFNPADTNVRFVSSISDDGRISLLGTATPLTLWDGFSCNMQLSVEETGQATLFSAAQSIGGYSVKGSMSIHFTFNRVIAGADCSTVLAKVAACFGDVTQCGAIGGSAAENSAQNEKKLNSYYAIWAPYLDPSVTGGTALMTMDQVRYTRALSYEAEYQ